MSLPGFETLRLPFHFCPNRLHQDIDRIQDDEWVRHFNTNDYDGDWTGVALRGPAWATHPVQSLIPAATEWADTPVLERCQYFAGVLDHFNCPLLSVRLLRLGVGSVIKEHTDYQLSLEDGEAASSIRRTALRYPSGRAMPKLCLSRPSVSEPFSWPITMTGRPWNRPSPPSIA